MHEISMAEKALSIIDEKAKEENLERVEEIYMAIGELTLINDEQFSFWMKELSEGGIASGCRIKIETKKAEIECNKCGYKGSLRVNNDSINHMFIPKTRCPECKSLKTRVLKGNEFLIKKISGRTKKT